MSLFLILLLSCTKHFGKFNYVEKTKHEILLRIENMVDDDKKLKETKILQIEQLRELIEKCENINEIVDNEGNTALIVAIKNGQVGILELLLKKGADKEASDKDGWTGLMYASFNNEEEIVRILLQAGVDVNKRAKDESTSLMWAAKSKNIEIVKMLLEKGAKVDLADKDGFTSLINACLNQNASDKDIEIAKALVNKDKSIVNQKTKKDQTALMFASKYGNESIVSFLLENGAEINAFDNEGCSALIYAVKNKKSKIVELLIKNNKIKLDMIDEVGYTALMWACRGGDRHIFRMLLMKGANRGVVSQNGDTALTLAKYFSPKCVSFWLNKSSSIDKALNIDEDTMDGILDNKKLEEIEKYLIKNEKDVDKKEREEIEKLRIEEIIKQDQDGQTILHKEVLNAIKDGVINKVVHILRKVENTVYFNELINTKDKNGQLAIHLGILNSTVLRILYSSGEYNNKEDSLGKTPLHYATEKEKIESIEVINEFASEEVNIKDLKGQTPLEVAIRGNKLDAIRSLLSFTSLTAGSKGEMFNLTMFNNLIFKENIQNKEIIELIYKHEIDFDFINEDNENNVLMNIIYLIWCYEEIKIRYHGQFEKENKEDVRDFCIFIKAVLKNELNKKSDFKHKNKEGKNILHLLTQNNLLEEETIIVLDRLKAVLPNEKEREDFLKQKDSMGNKPLDYAIDSDNQKVVKRILDLYTDQGRLIEERANPNHKNWRRNSDFDLSKARTEDIAEYFRILAETDMIKTLKYIYTLAKLPDNIENHEKTAIDITIEKGNEKAFELLMQKYSNRQDEEETILKILITCLEKDREELVLKAFKIEKIEEMFKNKAEEISKIFFAACYFSKLKVLQDLLLTKVASIDLADKDGETQLFVASREGKKEVVELLLEKGASIDLRNEKGVTALIGASAKGHKEVVELLLTKGAFIDLNMNDGWTALMIASANGHKEVVELLLSKGASIDLAKNDRWTSLIIASAKGHKEVVEVLLTKGASINLADWDGKTPLYLASFNGHKEVVELLLSKGASIDLNMDGGWTALMIASSAGHKEVVELLLTKGASIDLGDRYKETPLYKASFNGHREVVEVLLTKGASIDLATYDGWRALIIASYKGHKEVVELLLAKGASIDLADKDGETSLYLASENGHKEVVELLLTKGASIDLANKNRWRALYIASAKGHKEVVELLLTKGASIDLGNKNGATPLYIASAKGHKEVVELLLSKGASIDLATYDGSTPLMIASQNGHTEVVRLLLSEGASIDLNMNGGWTALMIASAKGHKEIVELLLTKGAKIGIRNKGNRSAIDIAQEKGHTEIVTLLESAPQKGKVREEEV